MRLRRCNDSANISSQIRPIITEAASRCYTEPANAPARSAPYRCSLGSNDSGQLTMDAVLLSASQMIPTWIPDLEVRREREPLTCQGQKYDLMLII